MADKRRYFERDSREKEAANSANLISMALSDSGGGGGGRHPNPYSPAGAVNMKDPNASNNYDDPPNSRLFILCGRHVSEEELRDAFQKFGTIKELWIVKDKASGESKGVAYIKFAKTSEAAVAMEEMNGKFLGNNAKSLKVLIANSRDQGSRRENNEEERLLRLFIIVPKSMSETELKEHFSQFGDVEHCNIVRDRATKENKGYAYVKFHRISHAAKAYEGCDRSFKPVFADPRPQRQAEDRFSSAHGSTTGPYDLHEYNLEPTYSSLLNHHHHHPLNLESPMSISLTGSSNSSLGLSNRLTVIAHGSLNQDQLWKLCDFFPGFEYCSTRHDSKTRQCFASVVYNSPQCAAYAKDKMHGFEYPPGQRLIVKFEMGGSISGSEAAGHMPAHHRTGLLGPAGSGGASPGQTASAGSRFNMPTQTAHLNGSLSGNNPTAGLLAGARSGPIPQDLAALAETIAQATSIIQAAGLGAATSHHLPNAQPGESYDPSYCSVRLPAPQPLAPIDSPVMERLFVVCQPSAPPIYALKDTFGRFGNLIDIFILNGKNFGYAKYASKSSADEAKAVLHGQEVCGIRLKVMAAEPQDKNPGAGANSNNTIGQAKTSGSSIGDQQCKRIKIEGSGGSDDSNLLD